MGIQKYTLTQQENLLSEALKAIPELLEEKSLLTLMGALAGMAAEHFPAKIQAKLTAQEHMLLDGLQKMLLLLDWLTNAKSS